MFGIVLPFACFKVDGFFLNYNVMFCAIWYHFYNLKNVENSHGGVLLLVKLQKAYNFTKSNTPPWMFFMFFKLYKWYQIAQRIKPLRIPNVARKWSFDGRFPWKCEQVNSYKQICSKHPKEIPANTYLFKINNRNTKKICKICSKLTINIFVFNFEHIIHAFLVALWLNLNR